MSAWHDGMDAGGPCARCRPHQRAGGGRRPSPQATEAKRSPQVRGRLQPGCRTGLRPAEVLEPGVSAAISDFQDRPIVLYSELESSYIEGCS